MTIRLVWLYLQSRRTWAAVAILLVVAGITWLSLERSHDLGLEMFLLTVMPLVAAAVIGASTGSPFGEPERSASRSLPALRLGQLVGLLLVAGLALALANQAESGTDTAWLLVRNGAGYAGLALLGARLLGSGPAWVIPVGYGLMVSIVARLLVKETWWLWPAQDTADGSAWASALVLLGLGLVVIVPSGAREAPGEVE
jgi:hypothetical protein